MSMMNGKRKMQSTILQKFNKTFNVYHLYEYCYKRYKPTQPQICRKYSNLFSYIHLMNKRSVRQQKQEKFINDWKDIIDNDPKFNFYPHLQELIKLLEIIEQKHNQIILFIQFLNQITQYNWNTLENSIILTLQSFRENIHAIFKQMLLRGPTINKSTEKRLKLIVQATHKEAQLGKINTEYYDPANFVFDLQAQQQRQQIIESPLHHTNYSRQIFNFSQQKNSPPNPYLVSSIKFFVKQKPATVKLLSKKQLLKLRQSINARKKSAVQAAVSTKQSQKAISHKIKSQNYNTYHTEIYEHSDESSSHQDNEKADISVEQRKGKGILKRHHRSNFQDAQNLKKILQAKESAFKYNSIHKIEGINMSKYAKNIQEAPSRYTIQTSSNANNSTIDGPAKKSRMNKISILGKLQKTIKKIPIKKVKKPRGGIFIPDQKLKDINEIYNKVKQNQSQDSNYSQSEDDSINESNANQQKTVIKDKRASEIIESSSQKQNKYKRRFGVSTKRINSNHSIDWYTIQARQLAEKQKKNDAKRTSFFRSSGSNLEDKKSIAKSKYNNQSHKKMKIHKQTQLYQERDSKDYEELAKKFALSRKSNQKLNLQQNIYTVDKKTVVSSEQMIKELKSIHQQDKLDRAGKYQGYYNQVLKRKFEGPVRFWNQDSQERAPTTFKMQEKILKKQANFQFGQQQMLFDLMLSSIKKTQNLQLQQVGIVEGEQ